MSSKVFWIFFFDQIKIPKRNFFDQIKIPKRKQNAETFFQRELLATICSIIYNQF